MLESLRKIVNELSFINEKELENLNSDKSFTLSNMSQRINEITNDVVKLILQYLSDYHKYFGKVF